MHDEDLYTLSWMTVKGGVKYELEDFCDPVTKEFIKISILLELERMKAMFGGK